MVASAPALPPAAGILALSAAPFRPGELPDLYRIELQGETRQEVVAGATTARVPAQLWLRIAVESSRLVSETIAITGQSAVSLRTALNHIAAESLKHELDRAVAGELSHYCTLLQRPHPVGSVGPVMPTPLPEEMIGAWRHAAITAGATLSTWVGEQVIRAPAECMRWEIAAAHSSRTLAEWVYASSLAAFVSSKA